MAELNVIPLRGVNDIHFGADSARVHRTLGKPEKSSENRELSQSNMDFLMDVCKRMSEMSGRPLSDYTKYIDSDDYDPVPPDENNDYYDFCRVDYDKKGCFECIEIYADEDVKLTVDGKDCSDFNLQTLLTLADDFVEEEDGAAWASESKQIGIWCPDGKVECILFGRPGYYDQLKD